MPLIASAFNFKAGAKPIIYRLRLVGHAAPNTLPRQITISITYATSCLSKNFT